MKSDTKIILVNDFGYVDGGASAVAIRTALLLAAEGNDVLFFCGEGPVCKDLLDSRVEVVCLGEYSINSNPSKFQAMQKGIWNKRVFEQFGSLLDSFEDREVLVHVHTWTKVLSSAVFAAATCRDVPLLLTVHDYFSVCPNGGLYDYCKMSICEKQPMSLSCKVCNCDRRSFAQKIWRVVRQAKQDSFVRNNKRIRYAFVSDYCKNILAPSLISSYPYEVLRNPVDHVAADKTECESNGRFLFVGRVSTEKGADLFCQAVHEIGAKGIVIGDGELLEDLREKYREDICFTGWMSPEEMAKCGALNSLAIVQPSRLHETALLTPLQFLEYGIPCIIPDRCAATDYVVPGGNGLVFRTGDLSDLKAKMGEMLRSPIRPAPQPVYNEKYLIELYSIYEKMIDQIV